MEQLRQRITVAASMQPLSPQEVEEYIRYRLGLVGWHNDPEISKDVFTFIHEYSQGIPRKINMICARLLLHGYVEDKHSLDLDDMVVIANELAEEQLGMAHRIPVKKSEPAINDVTKNSDVRDFRKLH